MGLFQMFANIRAEINTRAEIQRQLAEVFVVGGRVELVEDWSSPEAGHSFCPINSMKFSRGMKARVRSIEIDQLGADTFWPVIEFEQEHDELRELNWSLDCSPDADDIGTMPAEKALYLMLWCSEYSIEENRDVLRCFRRIG